MMSFARFTESAASGSVYPAVDVLEISPGSKTISAVVSDYIDYDGVPKQITDTQRRNAMSVVTEQPTEDDPPVNVMDTIDLYDPITGQATGTSMTYGEIMAVLYSVSRKLALD